MKERGMIFNGEMVRAILDGRKTQTCRLVKNIGHDNCLIIRRPTKKRSGVYTHVMDAPGHGLCPYGDVGDRIWVRETHHLDQYGYTYRADGDWIQEKRKCGAFGCDEKWTPSIHMKRSASRLLLEITNIRVERLARISDEDAGKEGYPTNQEPSGGEMDKWLWFRQLWDSIYPEQTFKHNPWVWVIEFKRIQEIVR